MTSSFLARALAGLGAVLLFSAVGWWWLVFRTLITNASMSTRGALPCLVRNSDLCTLAQALCTQHHFLGIRHYDTVLFWIGATLTSSALVPTLQRLCRTEAVP